MKAAGFRKLLDSAELTDGEKKYIFDVQYRHGGSFTRALFDAIAAADCENRAKLAKVFPEEVQGYVAWTEGDLYERASQIAGGDVDILETNDEPKPTNGA